MTIDPAGLVASLAPERLAGERWFADKNRQIAGIRLADALVVGPDSALVVLEVEFADGRSERYTLPHGRWAPLLAELAGGPVEGLSGRFELRDAEGLGPIAAERLLGVDQSHTSYVLDERVVLKCYRRLQAGLHPEVELVAFLSGRAEVPAARGVLRYVGADGSECALALLQDYVPLARDGWAWVEERLVAALAGEESVEAATAWASELGVVSARLHAALAQAPGARVATHEDLSAWRRAAEEQLDRVLGLVDAETAAELRPQAPMIRAELARFEEPAAAPLLTRVHGDYHVGQVLHSPAGFHVIDFEGEPTKRAEERRAPGSPLRDVAAMLRSFDHLARWTLREQPGAERLRAVEVWIAEARLRFLAAYGAVDTGLLRAFEVEKETYEFSYAASFVPWWTFVPRQAMRALLAEPLHAEPNERAPR